MSKILEIKCMTKDKDNVRDELIKLSNDLYNQGYCCGFNDENYHVAYATAMYLIVTMGFKFDDNLIDIIYEKIKLNEEGD